MACFWISNDNIGFVSVRPHVYNDNIHQLICEIVGQKSR
jgi:hypothetical protein